MRKIYCPKCGEEMVLRDSKYGRFYGCGNYPECTETHSAHQRTGEPMGIPADAETRAARIKAHEVFDDLWKSRGMRRSEAYSWMRRTMGWSKEESHISMLTIEQCEQLMEAVNRK